MNQNKTSKINVILSFKNLPLQSQGDLLALCDMLPDLLNLTFVSLQFWTTFQAHLPNLHLLLQQKNPPLNMHLKPWPLLPW